MADAELLVNTRSGEAVTKPGLLSELLNLDPFDLYRYSDDGPPPEVVPLRSNPMQADVYEGWAVVTGPSSSHAWRGVVASSGSADSWMVSGVMGNAVDVAGRYTNSKVYAHLPQEEAAERRRADELAAQVAHQALQADVFISERPYLHERSEFPMHGNLTVCDVDEALSLVGLYLRSQGHFRVPGAAFNRGLYFWVGTRELLPESWRWFSAAVHNDAGGNDHSMTYLAQGVLQRVARCLAERDAIHMALNQPQNNDTLDDALGGLEVVLLLLMGALDAAAQFAHRVLGIDHPDRGVAWQSPDWTKKVRSAQPHLAAVVEKGSDGAAILTMLRKLRNQIHGEALHGLAYQTSNSHESLMALPDDALDEVLLAADILGGRDEWGLRALMPEQTYVDPGVLVEKLLPLVLRLLNQLMSATPVENIAGGNELLSGPLPDSSQGGFDAFHPAYRASIRWQLGF